MGEILSVADDLKAAATDAIWKAASLFGVGPHVYGDDVHEPACVSPVSSSKHQTAILLCTSMPRYLTAPSWPGPRPACRPGRQHPSLHSRIRRAGSNQGRTRCVRPPSEPSWHLDVGRLLKPHVGADERSPRSGKTVGFAFSGGGRPPLMTTRYAATPTPSRQGTRNEPNAPTLRAVLPNTVHAIERMA